MSKELLVKIALNSWEIQIKRTDQLVAELTDEQLAQEVAPGRNSGTYLLGHLAAVHDAMNDILGLGESKYPSLYHAFVKHGDKSGLETPTVQELRKIWAEVNEDLWNRMKSLPAEEWLKRHTKMTDEDFAKDPERNKLSVLLNRTNHVSYHLGQMVFLKKK
ncbi:MAG: DinB family protein [Cytophaga sp.]|nr:DinB family protein [Cytophaga sp.]